jgi:hypothetical protein
LQVAVQVEVSVAKVAAQAEQEHLFQVELKLM